MCPDRSCATPLGFERLGRCLKVSTFWLGPYCRFLKIMDYSWSERELNSSFVLAFIRKLLPWFLRQFVPFQSSIVSIVMLECPQRLWPLPV